MYLREHQKYEPNTPKQDIVRSIVDAPWYIRNVDIHKDLGLDSVNEVIKKFARSHHLRLKHARKYRGAPTPR